MRFSELDGKTVGVWGAGVETRSLADQLSARMPSATLATIVLDDPSDVRAAANLTARGAKLVGSGDAVAALAECDVIVRSPGVSIYRPELVELRARGIAVVTGTGLWMAERRGTRIIGITATKGKSTTASLIAHLARAAGAPVHLAGNIGRAALDLLDIPNDELAVIELSSYQIADLDTGPSVAVLGNLFREHADWHGGEEIYRADKLRLLTLPGVRSCVVNGTDPQIVSAPCAAHEHRLFGVPPGYYVTAEGVRRDATLLIPRTELPLRGEHNALNLCAALTALEASGIEVPDPIGALQGFVPLRHRLEPVHERRGVLWVDDSISTTTESAIAAVRSYPEREIILIGGGQDRGQDYAPLATELVSRQATVLGLPSTGSRLVAAAQAAGLPPERAVVVAGLPEAVSRAHRSAHDNAVVLLSPAAPSYDSYRNYEERGDHFAALARASGADGSSP